MSQVVQLHFALFCMKNTFSRTSLDYEHTMASLTKKKQQKLKEETELSQQRENGNSVTIIHK